MRDLVFSFAIFRPKCGGWPFLLSSATQNLAELIAFFHPVHPFQSRPIRETPPLQYPPTLIRLQQ
jgi:hypothetical protein